MRFLIGLLLLMLFLGCNENVHSDSSEYYEIKVAAQIESVVLYTMTGDTVQVWKGDISGFIIYQVGECRFKCDGEWIKIYAGEGMVVHERIEVD